MNVSVKFKSIYIYFFHNELVMKYPRLKADATTLSFDSEQSYKIYGIIYFLPKMVMVPVGNVNVLIFFEFDLKVSGFCCSFASSSVLTDFISSGML